ncbi:MAG: hypothetical protein DMD35_11510 [Gemmatimonadetes bacterium]|nr:MAG: hypothetical protein DMD35_11510 [Gemmatimonadota bacterium]
MIGDRTMTSDAIAVVALSAWLGAAILVAAVVAPAAFAVLPTRALAGALVGRVLPVLFYAGAAAGLLSALLGRSSTPSLGRTAAGTVMIVTCLVAQLVVAPRIERLRLDAGRPIEELAADDPRRSEFGRLHGASVSMLGVAAIAAGVALALTLRTMPVARTTPDLSNSSASTDDG